MAPLLPGAPQPAADDVAGWLTPTLAISSVSAFISCLAFVTTIIFFRRLNTRRGKLTSARPHTFGFTSRGFDPAYDILFSDGAYGVVLPLVIYNDGAVPIIVQDIRLLVDKRVTGRDGGHRPEEVRLRWTGTWEGVSKTNAREEPAVFPVPGRTADVTFIEFSASQSMEEHTGEQWARVQVRVAHDMNWVHLHSFNLRLPSRPWTGGYTIFPNPRRVQDE